jgi:hypothetical protein
LGARDVEKKPWKLQTKIQNQTIFAPAQDQILPLTAMLEVVTGAQRRELSSFYERNGFRQKATFENYFGDGNTMIWLDCDLR